MRAQLANDQLGVLTVAAQRACVCACVRVCGMSKYVEREGEPMCVRCAEHTITAEGRCAILFFHFFFCLIFL